MAPRTTVDRDSSRRQTSLQKLLGIAKSVLQQAGSGREPLLTALDLGAAARAAREHVQQLLLRPNDLEALWAKPNQDTAAYLALFFLALRRSTPCHAQESAEFSYASLRDCFTAQLGLYSDLIEDAMWGSFCYHLLGPALLRTDALRCYSRLLAQAAGQLKPAAAAAAAAHPATHRGAAASGPHAEAVLAEAGGTSRGRSGQGEQHDSPRSQPPSLEDLEPLLSSVLQVVTCVVTGVLSGTTVYCATGPCPAGHPTSTARTQLQSSEVLEHWAQVLLLSSAAATASRRTREKLVAQGKQAELVSALCHQLHRTSHLPFADILRRACGCALAATHMAQLRAALDGGTTLHAAKPEVVVLLALDVNEQTATAFAERTALEHDASLAMSKRGVSVHAAVVILEAWAVLLAEALADGPHEATAEARACRGAGASAGRAGGSGSDVGQGPAEGHTEAAGASLCKLPPYSRTATFRLCLRLAKGVLACWGAPLQGVTLNTCVRGPNRTTPLLPKTSGSVLLHRALACARLALLPAVWGRERVPRRTRERLREWWETYVAAAQHPEALTVAVPEPLNYPEWACMRHKGESINPYSVGPIRKEWGFGPCFAVPTTYCVMQRTAAKPRRTFSFRTVWLLRCLASLFFRLLVDVLPRGTCRSYCQPRKSSTQLHARQDRSDTSVLLRMYPNPRVAAPPRRGRSAHCRRRCCDRGRPASVYGWDGEAHGGARQQGHSVERPGRLPWGPGVLAGRVPARPAGAGGRAGVDGGKAVAAGGGGAAGVRSCH